MKAQNFLRCLTFLDETNHQIYPHILGSMILWGQIGWEYDYVPNESVLVMMILTIL